MNSSASGTATTRVGELNRNISRKFSTVRKFWAVIEKKITNAGTAIRRLLSNKTLRSVGVAVDRMLDAGASFASD